MLRIISLVIFTAVLCGKLLASNDSTLFKTEFEQQLFYKIIDSVEVDPLDIMLAVDFRSGDKFHAQKSIENIIASLKAKGIEGKKTKKQIQEIYKSIHKVLLKKYIEDADFNQLFDKGEYNCVSATALYAIVLGEFNIDYEIRETPTHIYLVADPKYTNVLIESTLPQNGTIEFDYKTKKAYVEYLVTNKIISAEEFESTPVDKLFEKHYDQNKIIDLNELAALLYYNKGIAFFNKKDYSEASYSFKKANMIYPSLSVGLMYNSSLVNQLSSEVGSKKYNPLILASFVNFNVKNDEVKLYGTEYFGQVGNELMINSPDVAAYKEYFQTFKNMLNDSVDLDPFSQQYYLLLAYANELDENYMEALKNMNYSYISNPENLSTKEVVLGLARNHMVTDKEHEKTIDSLDLYFEIFPFLEENKSFQEYYSYCKMRVIRESFSYDMPKKGYEKLDEFEESLQYEDAYSYDKEYFANMYLDVAGYYGRKNNLNMVGKSIKRGLRFEPNSMLLNNKLAQYGQIRNEVNSFERVVIYNNKSREEQFKEDFNKFIVACWEIDGALNGSEEIEYDETLKLMTYKNNKVMFIVDGKTENGKFSIRTKSRLLYLTPDRDREAYIMYKVETISSSELILRPFVNGKMTNTRIYMNKCR